MNVHMQPLFWRLSGNNYSGLDAVSLLMPHGQGRDQTTEIPTDVRFYSKRNSIHPVDMRWSGEDAELFFALLSRVLPAPIDNNIEVDLQDKNIQGIVHLVAQMRFQAPWSLDDLLGEDLNTTRTELSIGDLVALNTCYGFPLAIVVGLDAIEVNCVLVEPVVANEHVLMAERSLLTMNRLGVLPATFADSASREQQTLH